MEITWLFISKEETQPKVRKRKKIKIRTGRYQIKARKIKKINGIKKDFSEMINKIDKPLAKLRKIMKINKILLPNSREN